MFGKKGTDLSDKDYQKLGKSVEKIIQKDYVDLALHWPRLIKVSFVRGLFAGLGSVLGATLLLGLLLWILSLIGLHNVVDSLRNSTAK